MKLSTLERALGYEFSQKNLLEQALTHRSHGARNNERLEFLGDAVLEAGISALLYERFSKVSEGDLTRIRASLVRQDALAGLGTGLQLSDLLRLGEGELKSGGFRRPSILADAVEAILGAVYLDGGFEAAQHVIQRLYETLLAAIDPKTVGKDAKTQLQEYLQGRRMSLPVYKVVATRGVAHEQVFDIVCEIPSLDLSVSASATSRRAAEQLAAQDILKRLESAKS